MTLPTPAGALRALAAGVALLTLASLTGCIRTTRPANRPGAPQVYVDPSSPGPIQGVGIEANDVVSMTDRMARDLLATPEIVNWPRPPRIVIDSRYFRNEGSARINRNLITDRLRVNLNRAADGRLVFLGRHYSDMVEDERALEEEGVVSPGTQGSTRQAAGWDYRLGGRIATLDKVDPRSGEMDRYYQITFELVERGTGALVWSNLYEFEKFADQDVVYH